MMYTDRGQTGWTTVRSHFEPPNFGAEGFLFLDRFLRGSFCRATLFPSVSICVHLWLIPFSFTR
jgi:hypothetical protein